jgi:Flp pilus assembly protein TadD
VSEQQDPVLRIARTIIPALLAFSVALVFHGVLGNQFVTWDDQYYVTNNPHIRVEGWDDVLWFFTHSYYWSYIPLTMLSHAADVAVHGMEPFGHHLSSLLLHAVNAVAFFVLAVRIARRWGGGGEMRAVWVGAIAAFVFALHPLRAESVSWVSDRKDLLCTFFLLLASLAWLRSTDPAEAGGAGRWKLLALVFHGAALLSKASALMFPVVLVVAAAVDGGGAGLTARAMGALRRALPHFLLSIAVGLVGIASVPAVKVNFLAMDLSGLEMALLPFHSIIQPLAKFVWPVSLSPLYGYPPVTVLALSALLTALVTAGVLVLWTMGRRGLLAAWATYLVLSVPTAVFFASGIQPIADRYTYLAMLPLALVLSDALERVGALRLVRWPVRRRAAAVLTGIVVVLVAWGVRSADQVTVWRDSLALWQHAARLAPDVPYVQNNLGEALVQAGYIDEAVVAYSIATQMRPDFADAFNNLGVACFLKRDFRRGIEALRRAEALFRSGVLAEASIADVYFNLASAYWEMGDTTRALEEFRNTVAERGSYAEAHGAIGGILLARGDTLGAVTPLVRAASLGDTTAARLLQVARPRP